MTHLTLSLLVVGAFAVTAGLTLLADAAASLCFRPVQTIEPISPTHP